MCLTNRERSCWAWAPSPAPSGGGWGIPPDLWPTPTGCLGTGSDCGPAAPSGHWRPAKKKKKDRTGQGRTGQEVTLKLCSKTTRVYYVKRWDWDPACDALLLRHHRAALCVCVCDCIKIIYNLEHITKLKGQNTSALKKNTRNLI